MNKIQRIYKTLLKQHGPQGWWPATTKNRTFEVIIGAILTQNTSWKNVEKAVANLAKNNLIDVKKIKNIKTRRLAGLIRSSGYHNQKAERLKIAADYFDKNDFKRLRQRSTKKLRQDLLGIKGIGPETADSILLYAFDKPSFVIDAYTKRIFSRLGFCDENINYHELQELFHNNLPKNSRLFNEYHALLVEHAKQHCSKKPKCRNCPLVRHCQNRQI